MADLSDVGDAIVNLIAGVLYPNGPNAQPLPDSPVKIYRGWPEPKQLDADLQRPMGYRTRHVSVFAPPGGERDTTRYDSRWKDAPAPAKTYAIQAVNQTITITGAPPNPYRQQNLAIFVSGKPYVVAAGEGDTPNAVAAALHALVAADWPAATVLGPAITLPALARVGALRVGAIGTSIQEVGRQTRLFHIRIWAESDDARTALARKIGPVLRAQRRLVFPDGFGGRFIYHSSHDIDRGERQGAYCRVFIYTVEYPTTIEIEAPEMIVGTTTFKNPAGETLAQIHE